MLTNKPDKISNYVAEEDIPAHTLVTFGTDDAGCNIAVAATDAPLGVTTEIDALKDERCDVILTGIAPVLYGADITKGDPLTAGADGKAVKAGDGDLVFGTAMLDGTTDDIGSINLHK